MKYILLISSWLVLVGCASVQPQQPYDYSAFRDKQPKSILVLPAINNSTEVKASNSFLSGTTYPLAEAGYYVLPIGLTTKYLIEQGITVANDAHELPLNKLHEIFGADAVLYININDFGSSYQVISSVATVSARAKLVDLASGQLLWENSFTRRHDSSNGSNLIGSLIGAVISQVMDSFYDRSDQLAREVNLGLFSLESYNYPNILPGPRFKQLGE